ncbi:hypothetical protein L596_016491 [Steinernema carpocapsae]|uniref:Uncharacterized protein n=1 Tax=Steinernema carpocapsae TaxID=34508 RepID=A0A4U5NJ05_STECR|nr:hypothetical protein L596_016491 [Steinernema carpocapsae]
MGPKSINSKRRHELTQEGPPSKELERSDSQSELATAQEMVEQSTVITSDPTKLSSYESLDFTSNTNEAIFAIADASFFQPGQKVGFMQDSYEMILLDAHKHPFQFRAIRSLATKFAELKVGQVVQLNNYSCKHDEFVKFFGCPVPFLFMLNRIHRLTSFLPCPQIGTVVTSATNSCMDSTTLKMYHGILCTLRLQGIRFPTTVTKKADNTKSYVANLTVFQSTHANEVYKIDHTHMKNKPKTEYADYELSSSNSKIKFTSITTPQKPVSSTLLEVANASVTDSIHNMKLYFITNLRVMTFTKVREYFTMEGIVTDGSLTEDGGLRCSCLQVVTKKEKTV